MGKVCQEGIGGVEVPERTYQGEMQLQLAHSTGPGCAPFAAAAAAAAKDATTSCCHLLLNCNLPLALQAVEHGMIKLGRHGIPMGVLPGKPTAAALRRLDAATVAEVEGEGEESGEEGGANGTAGAQRRKGETAEEKKARKAAVKEAKVRGESSNGALLDGSPC